MTRQTFLLKIPKEKMANKALVMGDPDRVILLTNLLDDHEILFNQRGIIVVGGYYRGERIVLASHGIGCGMASLVFEELGVLGVNKFIRLGTAGALRPEIEIGSQVIASGAGYVYGGSGLGMYLPNICSGSAPDPLLATYAYKKLLEKGYTPYIGPVFTSDALYAEENFIEVLSSKGFIAIEMEAACLYTLSWMRGWRSLAVLIISNNLVRKTPFKSTMELKKLFLDIASILADILIETE